MAITSKIGNSREKRLNMNRKWKEQKRKDPKNSPVLFEEDENVMSSPDEVRVGKSTPVRSVQTKLHSTPIKRIIDVSESPEMDYNESPIETLTQHPPSEVGWDYQRPVTREEDENSPNPMYITKTPKRTVLLTKKRNSNSPLLYKPMKKKLIQEEHQENLIGFVNELKAMEKKAKEIKDKKGEKSENLSMTEDNAESQLVVEMDSQLSDDCDIKLQLSMNIDNSPHQSKITTKIKNYNILLDDSIDDMMVMCSQEVEAKEFGENKYQTTAQPIDHLIPNKSKEKIPLKSSSNLSLEKMCTNSAKENLQPLTGTEKIVSDSSSKNSSNSKGDSTSLEIPDDSFDDFFIEIDDKDFCKDVNTEVHINSSTNQLTSKSNTKPISMKTNSTINSKTGTAEINTRLKTSTYGSQSKNNALATYNCKNLPDSNASVQTKIVNSRANFGYLNKDYAMRNNNNSSFYLQGQSIASSVPITNETRFLKSKSYSDSNFVQRNTLANLDTSRSTSNFGISANQQKYSAGLTGSENKSVRRIHSSSSLGSGRSQSTPAEIERKRQEAIMKREAKMRSQLSNPALNRPSQNSIK